MNFEEIKMENIKNFVNGIRSNFYVREPVYDSNVRVKRSKEGYLLFAIAVAPFIVALTLGVVNNVSG